MQPGGIVYIENIFLINLVMNLFLLRLTGRILGKPPSFLRCLLGSVLGSVGYCVVLCVPGITYTQKVTAGMIPVGTLMTKLGLKTKGKKELFYGTGWMFVVAFLLGGFMIFLKGRLPFFGQYHKSGIVIAGLGFAGYEIFRKGIDNLQQRKEQRFRRVRLPADAGELEITALVDTGNGLVDPISNKPVAVLEEEVWKHMQAGMRPEKYKVIPFHSIGKEHGILDGYEIEVMKVEGDMGTCLYENVIIAVFKGKISRSGTYQMILPPELSI